MKRGNKMTASKEFKIDGVIPIIPTPFTADEQIDWKSLRSLIDFARAADACAVCLPAYASEFYKLSEEERLRVVTEAVQQASGRIPVIAQVNYPSTRLAIENAVFAQNAGATAICSAVPRMFPLGERDLFRHFDSILKVIEIPLIIQDFNPGGPSISPQFVAELHSVHPHFRYVKLEEPMMASKVKSILQITQGGVGVLEGWGGMYLVELVSAGICGLMPGLGLTDILTRVYRLAKSDQREEAYRIFQGVLPQIVFSLQNLELFHHAEKLLLFARGVLPDATVRGARLELTDHEADYIAFLNRKILALLDELDLAHNPAAVGKNETSSRTRAMMQ
jgi:dihydrodipicolinate synthase/N-acetylneuraminate lyase